MKPLHYLLIAIVAIIIIVIMIVAVSAPKGPLPTNASTAPSPGDITPGTPGAAASLTNSQCRATCKGQCGRKPLIAITKKAKARKACHDNCRATICNWS